MCHTSGGEENVADQVAQYNEPAGVSRRRQKAARQWSGQLWAGGNWLFATEVGAPTNPRTDWDEWKKLLKTAGIRDGRLHDARHTAATVLLMLGVSERTIMGLMGGPTPP